MLFVALSTLGALWVTAAGLALGLCRAASSADEAELAHARRFGRLRALRDR